MRLVGGIVLLTWRARLQYLEEWSQHLGLPRARRPNGRTPAHTFAGVLVSACGRKRAVGDAIL